MTVHRRTAAMRVHRWARISGVTLTHEPDLEAGRWLVESLGPLGARIGSLVPSGVEAYARVLHPAEAADGTRARWADIAATCGTTLHPTAQLWRLVGDGRWLGGAPRVGTLDAATFGAVIEALATHRGAHADVVAALWEGFGWVDGGGVMLARAWEGDLSPQERDVAQALVAEHHATAAHGAFPPHVLAAPRLELPGRSYLLVRGALVDVVSVLAPDGSWSTPTIGSWDQTPNLLWSADRSWCLATEIDLDSTVVGGPAQVIDAVLAHPGLEALRLPADAPLTADADTQN